KQRQLYVAMTRAKSRLVMSGAFNEEKESSADNWFNDLREILADSDKVDKVVTGYDEESDLEEEVEDEDIMPDEASVKPLENYGFTGKQYFSPTALQTYTYCQRQYFYYQEGMPAIEPESENGDGGLPPHIVGSIIHKSLELYNGRNLEAAFEKAVEEFAEGNLAGARKAKEMLARYVGSDLYKDLPNNKLKELRFSLPLDDLFINGVIDCVVETDNGLIIVDYKTGRPPQAGEVKLGYAYQLALYKYAAEKILGKKVVEAKLHFLQDLSQWSLPMDRNHLAVALALCKDIGSKGKEEDFACSLASCKHCPYNYLCPQK
ncbi:MAG: PD-(D/E)XK nuclease family protein, partial [Phascolarctobacterium sp.]|nr:PD-(D/E)XK nuclease family protein [Phascolarctobacterium sp.]